MSEAASIHSIPHGSPQPSFRCTDTLVPEPLASHNVVLAVSAQRSSVADGSPLGVDPAPAECSYTDVSQSRHACRCQTASIESIERKLLNCRRPLSHVANTSMITLHSHRGCALLPMVQVASKGIFEPLNQRTRLWHGITVDGGSDGRARFGPSSLLATDRMLF